MEALLSKSTPAPRAPSTSSKLEYRAGIALSALPVMFLSFDSVIKIVKIAPVVQSFAQLGYPDSLARGLGLLELACIACYVIPRTAVLGAILLTGFLGGAISTHLRIGDPFFSHTVFPVYVALMVWGGLYLRNETLRALLPVRK
ncbi:MAG: DoxX family protein [Myxococcales bacterium]